jgi:hypothetical protein
MPLLERGSGRLYRQLDAGAPTEPSPFSGFVHLNNLIYMSPANWIDVTRSVDLFFFQVVSLFFVNSRLKLSTHYNVIIHNAGINSSLMLINKIAGSGHQFMPRRGGISALRLQTFGLQFMRWLREAFLIIGIFLCL